MPDLNTPFRHVMPSLTAAQRERLRDDLRLNGCTAEIWIDEERNILDGHHRYELCTELGIEFRTRVVSDLGGDENKKLRILSLNLVGRKMSPAVLRQIERQEKELAVALLAKGRGVREVARLVGRDHSVIRRWRDGSSGATPHPTQPTETTEDSICMAPNTLPPVVTEQDEVDWTARSAAEQKAQALRWHADGMRRHDIAFRVGRDWTTVNSWIKRPTAPTGPGRPTKVPDREIRDRLERGLTREEIAAELGLSPGTVSAATKRLGIGRAAKIARNPLLNFTEQAIVHASSWSSSLEDIESASCGATDEQRRELCKELRALARAATALIGRLNTAARNEDTNGQGRKENRCR